MKRQPKLQTETVMVKGEFVTVERSSGNIFADFGFRDANVMQLKAALAAHILRAIRQSGITQKTAAHLSGLQSSDMSNICNARLDGISVERLFTVLNRLGYDIQIRVSAKEGQQTLAVALNQSIN